MSGRPLVLTILDGWGYSPAMEGNAIAAARKPNYDALLRDYPNTLVHTSGPFVGLPDGQMGNSEVGHLNIGAGRIIHMDVTRIDKMIASGDLFRDPTLLAAMHHARASQGEGRRLHLMGLLSDGGVHSMNTHLYALLEMAKRESVGRPRYRPRERRRLSRSAPARDPADRRRPHRYRSRPLLCDGSRQALGPDRSGQGRDGQRIG
jgi:2,3-bisphosphoglycerate-independent phosphoglycerate mutase